MTNDHSISPFDEARLAEWLESLPGATRGPVRLERLGAGQSNLTYRAKDAEGHEVDFLNSTHNISFKHDFNAVGVC